jgi:dihydroorotase
MRIFFSQFRLVDAGIDKIGNIIVEDGYISEITNESYPVPGFHLAERVFHGMKQLVLMPALVDMHAHFRDPGFPAKETLESASLAAVAGGYGTVVCMANTRPVIDTIDAALALKKRSDSLGCIDLYPALSLTRSMEGAELSDIPVQSDIRLVSEDGKDVYRDDLFLAALQKAARAGVPVSCHCDMGGENAATKRAIELSMQAGCSVHIAHVSTEEAVQIIKNEKQKNALLTCEVTPHHLALTKNDACNLGADTFGKVAPPLRTDTDRRALCEGVRDGTIDVIATDHAPHSPADKAAGAPGFTGLETAFAVCNTTLVCGQYIDLKTLSALMSANPASILGLNDRGCLIPGTRADLIVVNPDQQWIVQPEHLKSHSKNTPFAGKTLSGKVLMTIHGGRITYDGY